MKGIIFDIKEFTVHDGPGIRITVFLKGCPLRCAWCHNPEGLNSEPELMIKSALCEKCGRCTAGCAHNECKPYGKCLYACPKGLISVAGRIVDSNYLSKTLYENIDFLNINGGGITLSGGEPLMQYDFTIDLLKNLNGIHRAIQTSGYASSEVFKKVIDHVDYVMMDIKIADSKNHKRYTGVDNILILNNFRILKSSGKPYVVRIPLIPGITDTEENLRTISKLIGDSKVELMPYNTLAGAKYASVNKVYTLSEFTPNKINLSIFKNGRLL